MKFVRPSRPRAVVIDRGTNLRLVLPAGGRWPLLVFFFVWLIAFGYGWIDAVAGAAEGGADAFFLFWLVAWSIAGPAIAAIVLWNVLGREIVDVDSSTIAHRYALGPLGWTRKFAASEIRDLRVDESAKRFSPTNGGGPIAFDYGARTYRFAMGIEPAEAKGLVETIRARLGLRGTGGA